MMESTTVNNHISEEEIVALTDIHADVFREEIMPSNNFNCLPTSSSIADAIDNHDSIQRFLDKKKSVDSPKIQNWRLESLGKKKFKTSIGDN